VVDLNKPIDAEQSALAQRKSIENNQPIQLDQLDLAMFAHGNHRMS